MPPKDSSQDHENEKIERLRRVMYSRSLSPRIKAKERRILEDENSPVGEDWVRPEPSLAGIAVAPRTIGMFRSFLRWAILAAFAFCIGAVVFFTYYFVIGPGSSPVSPGNIDIAVSGPLQIASGEPAELQIAVVNRNRTTLQLADLVVKYPAGTRATTDLLTDLPIQRIPLNSIESGGRRQGTVSAVFAGEEGETGEILVELEYRLEGSSAIFVASKKYEFLFASSPLSISVEGNNETVSGQPVELTVTVASNADAPVKDVLFSATYPFGFSYEYGEPKPMTGGGGNVWNLGDIAPGQKKSVKIQGLLRGESGDERIFRFSAGTRTKRTDQTIATTLADYAHRMTVSKPFLGLAVVVNRDSGSTSGTTVQPGDAVNVAVQWKNNLSTAVTDAVIVARLSGTPIDGRTVRVVDGFYRSSDNAILWDKNSSASLANLPPGASGNVTFQFQVPSGEAAQALRDPKVTITVHAAGKRVSESGVPESLQSTATQAVQFATSIEFAAVGLYYTSPFGSTGPMPPQAGQETRYAIVFNIVNSTNKIENAVVKAVLPPYVRWVGNHSPATEKFTFNPNDSTVTWDVGTIEAGAGVGTTLPEQAAIAVGFTPSTSQIGQQPALIRSIVLTGIDAATKSVLTRTAPDINTRLMSDPGFNTQSATVVE
jgi:hypothetical protein